MPKKSSKSVSKTPNTKNRRFMKKKASGKPSPAKAENKANVVDVEMEPSAIIQDGKSF